MKLDWDVVRNILLSLEDAKTPETCVRFTDFPDLDPQFVGYHMDLLGGAGLLVLEAGRVLYANNGDGSILAAGATRLTLDGHKLLDNIRSETVWPKVKKYFPDAGLAMSVGAVVKVAEKVVEARLGLGS